jgi:Protein of unknown function (DUF3179)
MAGWRVSVHRSRRQLAAGLAGLVALVACSAPSAPAQTEAPPGTPVSPATTTPAAAAGPTTIAQPTAVALSGMHFATRGWKTNFSKAAVPLSELESGGPPRDGIPPIDQPKFVSGADAGAWLKDDEPVIAFELNGESRAYPLQIMIWHEIVDDEVAGTPLLITFCPLCNTAIAFDRRVDGKPLRFGTTGNLRDSDLVMWSDDQGETWWQQITGEAIVGDLVGSKLTMLPAEIVSFGDFKAAFPTGQVLSRDTGHPRDYGSNPYVGYDNINSSPFLYSGPKDGRLPPMERVATLEVNGDTAAYPFSHIKQVHVVDDTVGGVPAVILYQSGTRSALDGSTIASSRDVGSATAFERRVSGRVLTFSWRTDHVVDDETGSTWDILGRATGGPLSGSRLSPLVSGNHFWFAWAVFKPDTRIWAP